MKTTGEGAETEGEEMKSNSVPIIGQQINLPKHNPVKQKHT
jgi:hypothetical protein